MKVCGFTFVRNGTKFDYPFVEAIKSILPICDSFIVAVGNSDDDTLTRVKSIDPKIIVIETVWDESLREGGRVLADETDKAFKAIPEEYDWAFYIQGDEVVHEKYLPEIKAGMLKYVNDNRVEGLLLNYKHFFGSYDFIGTKYSWYRREIRIVRNRKDIFSYRDAQGFRKMPNEKLNVKLLNAYMYHYGYVRNPRALKQKVDTMLQLYKEKGVPVVSEIQEYDYEQLGEPLARFDETHPAVMAERIKQQNWDFKPDLSIRYASTKDFVKRTIGRLTGWIPGEYRNYRII